MWLSQKKIALSALCLVCFTGLLIALLNHRAASQAPAQSSAQAPAQNIVPSPAQNIVPRDTEVGRYQIVPAGEGLNPYVYFLDTKTGQCWLADSPGNSAVKGGWQKIPSPVFPDSRKP